MPQAVSISALTKKVGPLLLVTSWYDDPPPHARSLARPREVWTVHSLAARRHRPKLPRARTTANMRSTSTPAASDTQMQRVMARRQELLAKNRWG